MAVVEDTGIVLDLSQFKEIKENIVYELKTNDYEGTADYSYKHGYIKVLIYDGLAPFMYESYNTATKCPFPSKLMIKSKFLKSRKQEIIYNKLLTECNTKFTEYFGKEIIFRCEFTMMQPETDMDPHCDLGAYVKTRFNLVFEDDKESGFQSQDFVYPLNGSKIYKMDVTRTHRAYNHSKKIRYGLIFEVIESFDNLIQYKKQIYERFFSKSLYKNMLSFYAPSFFLNKDNNG